MSSVVMAVSVQCWVHLVFYCTELFVILWSDKNVVV